MDKIWLEDYGFWIDERKYKYFVDKYEISDIINLNLTVGGTNMSNELQAFEALSKEEIMKMTGQDDGSQISSGILPRLAINRASEDDDGNALRTGVYTIYDSESEAKVYSLKDKLYVLDLLLTPTSIWTMMQKIINTSVHQLFSNPGKMSLLIVLVVFVVAR